MRVILLAVLQASVVGEAVASEWYGRHSCTVETALFLNPTTGTSGNWTNGPEEFDLEIGPCPVHYDAEQAAWAKTQTSQSDIEYRCSPLFSDSIISTSLDVERNYLWRTAKRMRAVRELDGHPFETREESKLAFKAAQGPGPVEFSTEGTGSLGVAILRINLDMSFLLIDPSQADESDDVLVWTAAGKCAPLG